MDESVPAHRDAPANSSRESASEPRVKVVSGSGKQVAVVANCGTCGQIVQNRIATKTTRVKQLLHKCHCWKRHSRDESLHVGSDEC